MYGQPTPTDDEQTTNRRQFIIGAAAAGTALIAGCLDSDGDSTTNSTSGGEAGVGEIRNTPVEAVEDFYTAYDDGDREAVENIFHPDGGWEINPEMLDADHIIEEIELIEQDGNTAVVEVERYYDVGNTFHRVHELVLKVHDNEWRVYDIP